MRNRVEVKDEDREAFDISAVQMITPTWTMGIGRSNERKRWEICCLFLSNHDDTYLIASSSFFLTLLKHFMAIFLHFKKAHSELKSGNQSHTFTNNYLCATESRSAPMVTCIYRSRARTGRTGYGMLSCSPHVKARATRLPVICRNVGRLIITWLESDGLSDIWLKFQHAF